MANNQNQNRGTMTLLLLLLIASIGFNVYQWQNHSETVVMYDNKVDSLQVTGADAERELESVKLELEKYRGIAGNLDTLLDDAKSKMAAQEEKIRKLLSGEKDAKKRSAELKKELEELRNLRDEYLEKIDNLMAENEKLKAENANLNNEVTNLSEQKNVLEGKVATASQLKAEYVKVSSFKKRSNGKYTESVLAKRTNKLEACFTIMDNKISEHGDKMIYLVITEPSGKVLMGYTKAQFTDADGKAVDATASQKVSYEGNKQDMCLSFENEERILEPGTYTIQIYAENVLVHQSSYVLK